MAKTTEDMATISRLEQQINAAIKKEEYQFWHYLFPSEEMMLAIAQRYEAAGYCVVTNYGIHGNYWASGCRMEGLGIFTVEGVTGLKEAIQSIKEHGKRYRKIYRISIYPCELVKREDGENIYPDVWSWPRERARAIVKSGKLQEAERLLLSEEPEAAE